ncbi:MAG TPA: glycosyltransferase [Anaeromyxobacteraceae bacterium]|nr:glycosyltransferase [Anaeromyxobacteraceae bacterium]
MPTYDGESYVGAALESVRAEAADDVEVVIVDDGSKDRTLEVVRRYEGALRLRLVPHQRVGNWVATTNAGLRAATGRFAAFLHQDDLWLPGRLAALRRAAAERPEARLLFHPAIYVGPGGERLGPWGCPLRRGWVAGDVLLEHLLVQNFIAIPSPIFDRAAALAGGGLDEALWYTADWDLWLRLGAGGAVYLDRPLAAFRVHAGSQTMSRRRSDEEFLGQMTTVLDRHLPGWRAAAGRRERVERVARFSAEVNAALSAAAREGRGAPLRGLAGRFAALGPTGWLRYLRDSRILERSWPRWRMQRAASG